MVGPSIDEARCIIRIYFIYLHCRITIDPLLVEIPGNSYPVLGGDSFHVPHTVVWFSEIPYTRDLSQ